MSSPIFRPGDCVWQTYYIRAHGRNRKFKKPMVVIGCWGDGSYGVVPHGGEMSVNAKEAFDAWGESLTRRRHQQVKLR